MGSYTPRYATKQCVQCGIEFPVGNSAGNGNRTLCSAECRRLRVNAKHNAKREAAKRPLGERACTECGTRFIPANRRQRYCTRACGRRVADRAMIGRLGGTRARTLWFNYKLTLETHDALLASQGGVCGICGTSDPGAVSWCVDHDHACCPTGGRCCGKCVRGLLCLTCNRILGCAADNPDRLRQAATYLEGRFDEHHANRNYPAVGELSGFEQ